MPVSTSFLSLLLIKFPALHLETTDGESRMSSQHVGCHKCKAVMFNKCMVQLKQMFCYPPTCYARREMNYKARAPFAACQNGGHLNNGPGQEQNSYCTSCFIIS